MRKKIKGTIYFYKPAGRVMGDILDICNFLRFNGAPKLADKLWEKSKGAEKKIDATLKEIQKETKEKLKGITDSDASTTTLDLKIPLKSKRKWFII